MKSARRLARELVVQGLYQLQFLEESAYVVKSNLKELYSLGQENTDSQKKPDEKTEEEQEWTSYQSCNYEFFEQLLEGSIKEKAFIFNAIQPFLDRTLEEMSRVELAVLWMATYELCFTPETPFRVILNEAIEVSRSFGGVDGHRYINGVLEKVASSVRKIEWDQHQKTR